MSQSLCPRRRHALSVLLAVSTCAGWAQAQPGACSDQWTPDPSAVLFSKSVGSITLWDPDGAGPSGPEPVISGFFQVPGDTAHRSHVLRWNGSTWQSLGSTTPFTTDVHEPYGVHTLGVYNGELIAAGSFRTIGGVVVNSVARWNGSVWRPFSTGVSQQQWVFALAVYNTQLIIGGEFSVQGSVSARFIARWDGSAWQALGVAPNGGPSGSVWALTVFQGDLIAGGSFLNAAGTSAVRVAKWNGSTWSTLGAGLGDEASSSTQRVADFAVLGDSLVAGGRFSRSGSTPLANVARWDGTSWSPMGTGIGIDNSFVLALATYQGDLYATGSFTTTPTRHLVRWRESAAAWGPVVHLEEQGLALATGPANLFVGYLYNSGTHPTFGRFTAHCAADFDDGTGTGICDNAVTIDDLLYYLGIFENGVLRADLDNGSGAGIPDGGVTIDDLLYFLFRFENGC